MEYVYNKVRNCILEYGNSNFDKINKSFITNLTLETSNTILLLEENEDISKITMSFFELFENEFFSFRIEKKQDTYILIGDTFHQDDNEIEVEIIEIESVLKVFENEIDNLIVE